MCEREENSSVATRVDLESLTEREREKESEREREREGESVCEREENSSVVLPRGSISSP